ncbi:MAG: hypothetical protein MZV64_62590 [Ignavibacteriales bacterium]|nr:hypothetical protein [Ignavibacteriales bacterium]
MYKFVDDYPAMRKELLDENGNFLPHMKFFVNGREAVYLPDKFDTEMKPEDKIDIFPPWAAVNADHCPRDARDPVFSAQGVFAGNGRDAGWMRISSVRRVERDAWRSMEPFRIGSLSVGQTRLTIEIEDHLVEPFMIQLAKKTLRAGVYGEMGD